VGVGRLDVRFVDEFAIEAGPDPVLPLLRDFQVPVPGD
jgi:hypothetical protein